jgi:hypothetical protein
MTRHPFYEVLAELERRHITITVDNGRAALDGNRAALTPDLIDRVRPWASHLAWHVHAGSSHRFAPCSTCAELSLVPSNRNPGPPCRMTPGCKGRHNPRSTP